MKADLQSIELAMNFTEALTADQTRTNMRKQLGLLTKSVGLDGFTWWYGTSDDYEEIDSRPKEWMEFYDDNECVFIDPIVKEAILTASPFRWYDVLMRPELSSEERGFMEAAADSGMRDGVHFPVGTIFGKWGCLSFFTDDFEAGATAWKKYRLPLTHCAFVCNQFSIDISMATNVSKQNLSRKQLQTMIALAAGKTREEAAKVLGISENTVSHHTKAILEKTSANNMVHAVAKTPLSLPPLKETD